MKTERIKTENTILIFGIVVIFIAVMFGYDTYQNNPPHSDMTISWHEINMETSTITFTFPNATITMTEVNGTIYITGSNIVIQNIITAEETQ